MSTEFSQHKSNGTSDFIGSNNTVPNFRRYITGEFETHICGKNEPLIISQFYVEQIEQQKELRSLEYLKLQRLGLQLRAHKNTFLQWKHTITILEDGKDSVLLIGDFHVQVDVDFTFSIYINHSMYPLYVERRLNQSDVLKALERYAQMNPAAYDPNDNLPF